MVPYWELLIFGVGGKLSGGTELPWLGIIWSARPGAVQKRLQSPEVKHLHGMIPRAPGKRKV